MCRKLHVKFKSRDFLIKQFLSMSQNVQVFSSVNAKKYNRSVGKKTTIKILIGSISRRSTV